MRKRRTSRLLIIPAASGTGKTGFPRAGLWPRLERDPDFAPLAIVRPALGMVMAPRVSAAEWRRSLPAMGQSRVSGDINGPRQPVG
jgi:hypothetical protein